MEETGKFSDLEESFMESKLRILISDDDKEFCSRCTAILRGCGFETTIAPRDGHLILEMIRDYQRTWS